MYYLKLPQLRIFTVCQAAANCVFRHTKQPAWIPTWISITRHWLSCGPSCADDGPQFSQRLVSSASGIMRVTWQNKTEVLVPARWCRGWSVCPPPPCQIWYGGQDRAGSGSARGSPRKPVPANFPVSVEVRRQTSRQNDWHCDPGARPAPDRCLPAVALHRSGAGVRSSETEAITRHVDQLVSGVTPGQTRDVTTTYWCLRRWSRRVHIKIQKASPVLRIYTAALRWHRFFSGSRPRHGLLFVLNSKLLKINSGDVLRRHRSECNVEYIFKVTTGNSWCYLGSKCLNIRRRFIGMVSRCRLMFASKFRNQRIRNTVSMIVIRL